MTMDDQSTHDEDDQQDIENDLDDTDIDDEDGTPNGESDEEESDDSKESAEEVKQRQKEAWLRKIRGGEKTLDDMPKNLGWLRKEVEAEIEKPKPEAKKKDEDLESRIRKTLQREREDQDFEALVDDLEESDIDPEKLAQVQEEYEGLRKEGVSKLRALTISRRLAGLKDSSEILRARRRKAMLLPPEGNLKRKVVKKDGLTDVERKFMNNLPPAYK